MALVNPALWRLEKTHLWSVRKMVATHAPSPYTQGYVYVNEPSFSLILSTLLDDRRDCRSGGPRLQQKMGPALCLAS